LLAPFAPYIAEELWEHIGQTASVHSASWPDYDPQALLQESMVLPIQINGRLRARLEVASDTSEEDIKQQALATEKIQKFIAGHALQRIIYVPGRLVNIVIE
jgi:leucyl-tRNA synthetase